MREPGDLKLTCTDCRFHFVLTARELAFYDSRALQQPRRCEACRSARRKERVSSGLWPEDGQGGR